MYGFVLLYQGTNEAHKFIKMQLIINNVTRMFRFKLKLCIIW